MTERHVDTINLGKGIKYAKVASRLTAFHEDNEQCQIETQCEFKDGYALFSAKLTTKKGTFTGHSLAKVTSGQKQFEKQETIAVGRALAFAGYLSSGEIASQEEMVEFTAPARTNGITLQQFNELKKVWAEKYSDLFADCQRDENGRLVSESDLTEQRRLFAEWVQQSLGPNFRLGGEWDPNERQEWNLDDFKQCREALK